MKKMLNEKGEKIKVNKGRELEMNIYKHFGVPYVGIDNIKTSEGADLVTGGKKYDIKSERGSIITSYGDARKAKDLSDREKAGFVNLMLEDLFNSIDEKRTFLFSINGLNDGIVYQMSKTTWKKFLKEFAVVDNATDKGNFLKIRLDAKSDRMYGKMVAWLIQNNVKGFNL